MVAVATDHKSAASCWFERASGGVRKLQREIMKIVKE